MDVRAVVERLNGLDENNLDMRLYFTRKKPSGRYQSFSPSIGNDLQKELKGIVTRALEKVQGTEQREFSPVGSIDGCIETHSVSEVDSFNDILASMEGDVVVRREIEAKEVNKLTFYCLNIGLEDNGGNILFFRRVTKFNHLKKGGILGRFVSNDFEKLDDTLLGLDANVDIVIFGGEMLILNHISLERIFSIQDQYTQKASQTLELVERSNRISNFDQFREDCLSDMRITRALTKILNEEDRINQVFENFENVIQVIDIFGLDIEIEEENTQLVYQDKSQLMDLTRLIRDSFYRSLINQREGIDEGV
ncbi:Kiwa anti-phage protein KwaB-like domain-containing protein [Priestia megaterium]